MLTLGQTGACALHELQLAHLRQEFTVRLRFGQPLNKQLHGFDRRQRVQHSRSTQIRCKSSFRISNSSLRVPERWIAMAGALLPRRTASPFCGGAGMLATDHTASACRSIVRGWCRGHPPASAPCPPKFPRCHSRRVTGQILLSESASNSSSPPAPLECFW